MQEYSLIYEKLKMEELIKEISKIVDNDIDENKIILKDIDGEVLQEYEY